MSQNEFTGMLIVSLVTLVGLLVWFGTAVWKLSSILSKMEVTISHVLAHSDGHEKELEKHREVIGNHETRIRVLEAVTQDE